MIVSSSSPASIACFVSIGSMSTAARRRAAAFRLRLIGSARDCRPVRLAYQPDSSLLKGTLHAPGPAYRLLGARPDRRRAAQARTRGGVARVRFRLVGRGLRLRRRDGTGLDRRPDREGQARLGDLPDARALSRDDGDDGRDTRPAVEWP